MNFLFYRNEIVGEIEIDEEDPPFYSGYFVPCENPGPEAEKACQYLLFSTREFDLKEGSNAYLRFEKEKESLFPDFIFSEEWRIGNDLATSLPISDPLLAKEGLIFWSDIGW